MDLQLSGIVAGKSVRWRLDAPPLRVGRSSRNALALEDPTVSKEHAEIVRLGDGLAIRDLGSRNGTRVNGQPASEPLPFRAGDRVEIGHVVLEVSAADEAPRIRLTEASVIGTTRRLLHEQLLERHARPGSATGSVVRLLAEAGRLLVLPRPLHETCDEILRLVGRAIPASRLVLMLRDGPDGGLRPISNRSSGPQAERPLILSSAIVRVVLDECASVVTSDALADPRFQAAQSIVSAAVRSAMAVPLFDDETVLGLLYADSLDPGVRYGEEDLEVLTLMANMAAVKIKNARLLDAEQERARLAHELGVARQIQLGLLPRVASELAGCQVEAFIESCTEVGGDLYDFRVRADGSLVLLVGDVSGKGMGAALLMSSFLSTARVLYDMGGEPGALAASLSDHLGMNAEAGRFVTGFLGFLDPATGELAYVNAGHPPPRLVSADGTRVLEATGIPFGMIPGATYETGRVTMRPGETLVLFSDGIPEAQREGEFFDEERLDQALLEACREQRLEDVRRQVLAGVDAFLAGSPRTDDLTLVLLRLPAAALA
jgi:serine phosphatase RsbU (regulator of sigma subunit)/pSer/pThr/pTyr-binding forkhead associated (FHA) protein